MVINAALAHGGQGSVHGCFQVSIDLSGIKLKISVLAQISAQHQFHGIGLGKFWRLADAAMDGVDLLAHQLRGPVEDLVVDLNWRRLRVSRR